MNIVIESIIAIVTIDTLFNSNVVGGRMSDVAISKYDYVQPTTTTLPLVWLCRRYLSSVHTGTYRRWLLASWAGHVEGKTDVA